MADASKESCNRDGRACIAQLEEEQINYADFTALIDKLTNSMSLQIENLLTIDPIFVEALNVHLAEQIEKIPGYENIEIEVIIVDMNGVKQLVVVKYGLDGENNQQILSQLRLSQIIDPLNVLVGSQKLHFDKEKINISRETFLHFISAQLIEAIKSTRKHTIRYENSLPT
jgi:hypothetical protein